MSKVKLLWRYQIIDILNSWASTKSSNPIVCDLENNGLPEVIVPSFPMLYAMENETHFGIFLYVLTHGGNLKWRTWLGEFDYYNPVIADLDCNNSSEIIVPITRINSSLMGIMSSDGEYINIVNISVPPNLPRFIISDLDSDGNPEIIVPQLGSITAISWNGSILWNISLVEELNWPWSFIFNGISIVDLDKDGFSEILLMDYEGYIDVLSYDGRLINRFRPIPAAKPMEDSLTIADLDGDGVYEIVLSYFSGIIAVVKAYSPTSMKLMYKRSLYPETYSTSTAAAADIDGDGKLEIIIGARNGRLYFFNYKLDLIQSVLLDGAIEIQPAIGDMDGDGELEILVGTLMTGSLNSSLYCIDLDGEILWRYEVPGWISATPALGDIDLDDRLEVIFTSCYGYVYALDVVDSGKYVAWPTYLGNSYRTSAYIDLDNDYVSDYLEEYMYGCDPAESDSDNDGLPDGWELRFLLDPLDPSDARSDRDGDGLSNIQEYKFGTNPLESDSDGDGYADGLEIFTLSDPRNPSITPPVTIVTIIVFTLIMTFFLRKKITFPKGIKSKKQPADTSST